MRQAPHPGQRAGAAPAPWTASLYRALVCGGSARGCLHEVAGDALPKAADGGCGQVAGAVAAAVSERLGKESLVPERVDEVQVVGVDGLRRALRKLDLDPV